MEKIIQKKSQLPVRRVVYYENISLRYIFSRAHEPISNQRAYLKSIRFKHAL